MKKLVQHGILYVALIASPSAYCQRTYIFSNYQPSVNLDAPVFDAQGNRLNGSHYVALLYGGPTTDDLQVAKQGDLITSMDPVPFISIRNGLPGYFTRTPEVIITTAFSDSAWLQVRAWDTRLGASYDEVSALGLGGFGQSTLFYALGGDVGGMGRLPQPLRGLESFSLVPEPGTWALLAFGAGVLFWKCSRRREANAANSEN
jgi:hypothetical protein